MKSRGLGLSLKYKMLLLLTLLPIATLAVYLTMSVNLFAKDKVAYVFDSSVAVARSLATQVRVESQSIVSQAKPVIEGFDYSSGEFSASAKGFFASQHRLKQLTLVHNREGQNIALGSLSSPIDPVESVDINSAWVQQLLQKTVDKGTSLLSVGDERHLLIAYRITPEGRPDPLTFIALYDAKDLFSAFNKSSLYQSYLITSERDVIFSAEKSTDPFLFTAVVKSELPEGTLEHDSLDGEEFLISYSRVGFSDLIVVSRVDKSEALSAVREIVAKSIMFFIALIAFTIVISLIASSKMTATLRELYSATKQMAQGHFDIFIHSRSRDEVGGLADSFNWMVGEVRRLLMEATEKARMESELETTRAVQETLFPPLKSEFGNYRIEGHYEPASECGGDWWNYSITDNKVQLWIGDATGHGAPSALITSAARSAASVIEMIPNLGPAQALQVMNHAIYSTSKGQIMMTFFLAEIDLKTNVLTYANASHDPPYLIRRRPDRPLHKKDLMPLVEVNGPRLGESPTATYQQHHVQLQHEDTVFFYTDGVIDVENPQGEVWGERAFIKALLDTVANNVDEELRIEDFKTKVLQYRREADLKDDITLFKCEYRKAG